MTARSPARRLLLRAVGPVLCVAAIGGSSPGCYSAAGGTAPPPDAFYFPVGLAVSGGGNVLYAVNSDFDLQWNGGTLQSYDLFHLRHDTAELINENFAVPADAAASQVLETQISGDIQFIYPWHPGCTSPLLAQTPTTQTNGSRVPLGEACAPPVQSQPYILQSAIIGAFATDVQLSRDGSRLFAPVRGDGTVTWADVIPDSPDVAPAKDVTSSLAAAGALPWPVLSPRAAATTPADLYCGQGGDLRCDARHHTGAVPDALDSRQVTLPGEPFAMAQTPDGTALVVTHQTSTQTSLLLSGLAPDFPAEIDGADDAGAADGGAPDGSLIASNPVVATHDPSMQFVLTGMPNGGDGLAAVPHDPDGPVPPCELVGSSVPCVRPAFLETSHNVAEIDLLRYYDDDGSSIPRPFLVREAAYTLSANAGRDRFARHRDRLDPARRLQGALARRRGRLREAPGARLFREPHPAGARHWRNR